MPRAGITASYIDFVQSCDRAILAHLYQFTSISGSNDYFTDLDFQVGYQGITYKNSGIRIDGLRRKTACGLEVDEQKIKIYALPTDTLFGANFLTGAEEGLLDGCLITRYRAVFPVVTGNLLQDVAGGTPVVVFTMFTGYASEIAKGGQTVVEMKIKSPLVKLEINMPRNYWQPGCLWNLFDVGYTLPAGDGCTLSAATYQINDTVASANTTFVNPSLGVSPVTGADGINYYAQGRLLFTSGVNNGLLTLITNNNSTSLQLAYALNSAPSPGDSFSYWPGCSKSFNTCNLKFNNSANFRGFDKVPPIQVSI